MMIPNPGDGGDPLGGGGGPRSCAGDERWDPVLRECVGGSGTQCPDGWQWSDSDGGCIQGGGGGGKCPEGTSEGPDGACHYPDENHGGGPGGGGGGGGGGNFPVFSGGGGIRFNIPGVPQFTPPQFTAPGNFQAPSPFQAPQFKTPDYAAIQNDPSFKFRMSQGQKALESSAAARGTLNTGGTLKGIVDYGQALASQEAGNVFNRALQSYDREYQGSLDQYRLGYQSKLDEYNSGYKSKIDEFDRLYAGAKDAYAPLLAEWQMRATANMRQAELDWKRQWDAYLASLQVWMHQTPSAGQILQAGMY